MATRTSSRSSDGLRPRSKSGASAGAGRPPSSPRTSDAPRQSTGRSSASPDKPMPSFLRPTVSSSLHSSTSSSSSTPSSSSKGLGAAAKRSADKAPAVPRPITPKEKANSSRWSAASLMQKASNAIKGTKTLSKTGKEAASSSSGKEAARPASSASRVKVAARPASSASSSGKVAMRPPASAVPVKEAAKSVSSKQASSETVIAEPVEEEHQQPETPAESLPPAVQAEKAVLEPTAVENEQHETTSQQVAGTDITAAEETEQTEQDRAEQPTAGSEIEEIVEEENHVMDDAEGMNVETPEPEPQEQKKLQSSAVAEAETEAQENTGDESPTVVVEEAAKEVATLEAAEDEPATSMVEKTVVQGSRAEEKPQEEGMEPEDLRENSETSVVSEEPKEETSVMITEEPKEETSVIAEEPKEETSMISEEPKEETSMISEERKEEKSVITEELKEETSMIPEQPKEETSMIPEQPKEETSLLSEQSKEDPPPVEKQVELPEGAELSVASSATAAPEDEETSVPKQASASEPVTPVQEAVSKDKAVIEALPSASELATPAIAVEKAAAGASSRQTTVPEGDDSSKLAFKGSKVKTAMEKRSEEEQPKKKEVARSNDVIEVTKSRLLEKRKSKVKALVGAFETVMDSPPSSS